MAKPKNERDALVAELGEIAAQLAGVPRLYERRLELFKRGRAMDPPILQRELAEASGITETAVTKELKRDAAKSA